MEGAVYARDICTGRDGLYYYGARYLDSRSSMWLSPDPALGDYLPNGNKDHDSNLPGLGGVFNPVNLAAYHFAGNNPVKYTDPDGKETKIIICPPQISGDFYHYTHSVNTGNFFGDTAMGAVANIANVIGAVVNVAVQATTSAWQTIDSTYSSVTMAVIGQNGFSGNGLSGDSFVVGMATLGMPAEYQAFQQGMKSLGTWVDGLGASDAAGAGKSTTAPIGRRGNPLEVITGTNTPTTINSRTFTGHALDQMQGRGIMPSVVENAIKNGVRTVGNTTGTFAFTNDTVKVIVNTAGDVVTVIPR